MRSRLLRAARFPSVLPYVCSHEALLVAPQFTVGRSFKGVIQIVFNSDGSRVATAGGDGTARLWDAATGQQQLVLRGHQAPVDSVSFSTDGKLVATSSDDESVRLWDAMSGELVRPSPARPSASGKLRSVPMANIC